MEHTHADRIEEIVIAAKNNGWFKITNSELSNIYHNASMYMDTIFNLKMDDGFYGHHMTIYENNICNVWIYRPGGAVVVTQFDKLYEMLMRVATLIGTCIASKFICENELKKLPHNPEMCVLAISRYEKKGFSSKDGIYLAPINIIKSDTDGLEIKGKDGEWKPVKTVKGEFIVIMGDHMKTITKGNIRVPKVRNNNSIDNRLVVSFHLNICRNLEEQTKILYVQEQSDFMVDFLKSS